MLLKFILLVLSPTEDRLSQNLVAWLWYSIRVQQRCLGKLERGQRKGFDG